MKNAKCWMGLMVAVLLVGTIPAVALTEKVDGLDWNYTVDGEVATLVGANRTLPTIPAKTQGRVSIPATLGGYLVTGISTNAFSGCTGLTEVVIAAGVTNIGPCAFRYCSALTNMAIPDTVTEIGSNAFQWAAAVIHDTNRIAGLDLVDGWAVGWNRMISAEPDLLGVRGIAGSAFAGCSNLVSATIPDNVRSIGDKAFAGCSNLVSATIPGTVWRIGGNAFARCFRLESVSIGHGVERIGPSAFHYCNSLSALDLPDTVTEIGDNAFYGCTGLTEVSIPGSVRDICYGAFDGCSYLTNVWIGNGVTNIGQRVFGDCFRLETIAFPDSAKQISHEVCNGCSNLCWMFLPGDVEETLDHYREYMYRPGALPPPAFRKCAVVFGSMHTAMFPSGRSWQYSVNAKGEATVWNGAPDETGLLVIPTTLDGYRVVQIGSFAFKGRDDLIRVIIPEGVKWIADYAFNDCDNLLEVSLPDSLKCIEDRAFRGCSSLVGDDWAEPGFVQLDGWLLEVPTGRTGALDLSRVRGIGEKALQGCKGVTSVVVGDKVKGIGRDTFHDCTNLVSVTLSDTVGFVGSLAFCGCSNLQSVTIGRGVELLRCRSGWITTWGGTPDIHIHDLAAWCNIDFCGEPPLKGCRLFLDGEEVTELVIPAGVPRISDCAFAGCPSLQTLTIPDGVEAIGRRAFTNCPALATVTILGDVEIGLDNFYSYRNINHPFESCTNLQRVVLGGGMTRVPEELFARVGFTSLEIGEDVTDIGARAFMGCGRLESLEMGASVTNIGDEAFSSCSALLSVAIPDGVTSIGESAFRYCGGLKNVTIPERVTSIGSSAFYGCNGLTNVTIFGNVTNDWQNSSGLLSPPFGSCTNISRLVLGGKMTKIGNYMFYSCPGLSSVTIPDSVTSIGSNAFSWCTGLTNVTIGNSATNIGGYAFIGCNRLPSMTIPDNVASIGDYVFYGCTGLANVTIGSGVASIGDYAFYSCTKLPSVTIPVSVTSIGKNAFSGCSDLKTLYAPESWKTKCVYPEGGGNVFWSDWASVPLGCEIIYVAAPEEETTSTGVPHSWLAKYGLGDGTAEGYEAAAAAAAANGRSVRECYVAGLDPTDAGAEFLLRSMRVSGGAVEWECEPDWSGAAGVQRREYHAEGATSLEVGDWTDLREVEDVELGEWRFFRVVVEVP